MGNRKGSLAALLPIGVFLTLYLGTGIVFEYVLKIENGFYAMPVTAAFLGALAAAFLQKPALKTDEKLAIIGKGIGDKNVTAMLLIFLEAGVFTGTAGRDCAESVAYLLLSIIPPHFSAAALFIISCFISLAMGTSVGTISLITPIGAAVSSACGFPLALCTASVIGGAMFGDNLSFISDTTIAVCRGQGCRMKDKFRENLFIALPAAVITLLLIFAATPQTQTGVSVSGGYSLIMTIPYILVLIGGIIGINVFAVLAAGIVSGAVLSLVTGAADLPQLLADISDGISGMLETCMAAILASAVCALIKEYGGFDALLFYMGKCFRSKKTGQLGIGLLAGAMDIATANNTIAIIISNPIAADMAAKYGVTPGRNASLLDTFSCSFQGILPYGAQMLVAVSAASSLGTAITAFDIIPFLFYPFLLLISSLAFIFFIPDRKGKTNSA